MQQSANKLGNRLASLKLEKLSLIILLSLFYAKMVIVSTYNRTQNTLTKCALDTLFNHDGRRHPKATLVPPTQRRGIQQSATTIHCHFCQGEGVVVSDGMPLC